MNKLRKKKSKTIRVPGGTLTQTKIKGGVRVQVRSSRSKKK